MHGLRNCHDGFAANIEQVFDCEDTRIDAGGTRSRWTCSISRERFATCFSDRVLGESLIYEGNVTDATWLDELYQAVSVPMIKDDPEAEGNVGDCRERVFGFVRSE
jgi:hypothetical protein